MTQEIFVTSLGETTAQVLNAIATFFQSSSWPSLITLLGSISIILLTVRFILNPDHKGIAYWALAYIFIPALLITPKTTVIVKDLSDPLNYHTVDNVPSGLAVPAAVISDVMYHFNKQIADIFHTPNDTSYNQTGMIFGARLYQQMRLAGNRFDPKTMDLWSDYIYNCIRPDVTVRNRYTFKELFHSTDIFAFLSQHPGGSFNRVKTGTETYKTCKNTLPVIKKRFHNDARAALMAVGAAVGDTDQPAMKQLKRQVQMAYSRLFKGYSGSAMAIMEQNMAINALRDGIMSGAAQDNAAAASINYAVTQNEMTSTAEYWSIGQMMRKFIPMLQTILFLLVICSFIPTVLVALLPGLTYQVLRSFAFSLVWILSWNLFYVFLDFIMQSTLTSRVNMLVDATPQQSNPGLTLANADPVQHMISQFGALTGYLMMFVPYLSMMVFKGAASVMNTMATSMGHIIGANARTGAAAMATGDYSLFNTSTNNHTMNNTQGNKIDTLEQVTDPQTGTTTTHLEGGQQAYNVMRGISQLATSVTGGEQLSTAYQQSAQSAHNLSEQYGERAEQSIATGLNEVTSASAQQQARHTQSTSDSNSEDYKISQEVQKMQDVSDQYTDETVNSFVSRTSASLGANAKYSTSNMKEAGFSLSANASGEQTWTWTDQNDQKHSMTASDAQKLMDSYSSLESYGSQISESDETSTMQDIARNFSANLQQGESYARTSQQFEQLSRQQQTMAQQTQSENLGTSTNLNRAFQDWFQEQHGEATTRAYFSSPERQQTEWFQQQAHQFIEDRADNIQGSFEQKKASILNQQQQQMANMDQVQAQPRQTYAANSGEAIEKGQQAADWQQQSRQQAQQATDPYTYINQAAQGDFTPEMHAPGGGEVAPVKNPAPNPIGGDHDFVPDQPKQTVQHQQDEMQQSVQSQAGSVKAKVQDNEQDSWNLDRPDLANATRSNTYGPQQSSDQNKDQ